MNRRKFIKGVTAASVVPLVARPGAFPLAYRHKADKTHRILCCNIRVALDEDEAKGFGWSSRKDICLNIIKDRASDIICLQEVLKVQAEDFKEFFPDFQLIGFDGPEMDAHATGYHGIAKNPILFSTDRYELVAAGTYWLSETPLIAGSKSWDTARARHANWVRLEDRHTKQHFRVINLHLDHVSQAAKEGQVKLVLEESAQYTADFPQLLIGDFNANMENKVYHLVENSGWKDTYTAIHGPEEPGYTVHLFQGDNYVNKDKGRKIDFIFGKGPVRASAASIIRDHVDGQYPSDHYFVSADVRMG